jgi:hypothetical protein
MCEDGPDGEECLIINCDENMLCCIEDTNDCADCTDTELGDDFNPGVCIP